MDEYSIWPSAICLLIFLLVASSPLVRAADVPTTDAGARLSSLDGLRGFLALAVFFHHGAIFHNYWLTGKWQAPPSRFYALLGPFGVGSFFMITGYLFWAKLVKENGKPNWLNLYIGRVFRIGPLYLGAVLCMLSLVAFRSHFRLHEPLARVFVETVQWLALGLYWPHDVNAFAGTNQLLAGVTWSLQYEWFFYLSLLVTGLVLRCGLNDLTVSLGGLALTTTALWLIHPTSGAMPVLVGIELFLIGMSCASIRKRDWTASLPPTASSAIVVAIIGALMLRWSNPNSATFCLLLGFSFFLVVSGCSVYGLLTTRAARRLGDVSYGIYLLQGLVLTGVAAFPAMRRFSLSSPLGHWSTLALAGIALIAIATLAHVLLERPGILWGKSLIWFAHISKYRRIYS